jgi:hypothetical protein
VGLPPGPLFLTEEDGQEASFVKPAKTAQRASKLGARHLRNRFVIETRTAGATREVIDVIRPGTRQPSTSPSSPAMSTRL